MVAFVASYPFAIVGAVFLVALFFGAGAIVPSLGYGLYSGAATVYNWATGKYSCYNHRIKGEFHVSFEGFRYRNLPTVDEGFACDGVVNSEAMHSCFRRALLKFDNQESMALKVHMITGTTYYPASREIIFDRDYEDDFKYVTVTLYNWDKTQYSRKLYFVDPLIGERRKRWAEARVEWPLSTFCHLGRACLEVTGNITLEIQYIHEDWEEIDCPKDSKSE